MHECPNGKRYIGITKNDPQKRWKNGKAYKGNAHFTNAVKKYGWDNIKHVILHKGLSKEEACNYEVKYIELYQTYDPEYGYNLTHGGESGYICSEETLNKLSNSHKGKRLSLEQREKISKTLKGRKHTKEWNDKISKSHIGITHTEDSKKKMSISKKGIKFSDEVIKRRSDTLKRKYKDDAEYYDSVKKRLKSHTDKLKMKVMCVETGFIFESLNEAARFMGKGTGNIHSVCSGRTKTAYGFHWMYVE